MTVLTGYITVLLLQTVLILQESNGWSSGPRQQQFPRYFQPQQDCCRPDNYIGLVPPMPPSYDRYKYEGFQTYHNKHNYNRRYLPSKYSSYSKGQSHIPSYVQRRAGFGFADDHYIKKPYNKAENGFDFRNSPPINRPYYDKDYAHNDRESQSDKYSPGLLLSFVADRQGTIIVTDPDGIKHRINSISLKELELSEGNKPFYSVPGNINPIKNDKPSHDFPELKIASPKNVYIYPNHKTAALDAHYNGSFSANTQKGHNGYTSSSAIRFPDVNDFHPSPPFHKYSEPDPLFHPNGSPLQTHSPEFITLPPTGVTTFPTPRKQPTFPDSINAQLPDNNENTNVPYVRDEVSDTKSTSATQATEVIQKRLLLTPTTPGNNMISSTQRSTREDQKKWDFLPTVQQVSSSPNPVLNRFSTPYTFSTESPTHAAISTPTPESNPDTNPTVPFSTAATKLDFSETVNHHYELQQEPTTEAQLSENVNATPTSAASIEPEMQTDTQSTASVLDIENVTKLEEMYFNSMSNATLYEEMTTTVMPDITHTY